MDWFASPVTEDRMLQSGPFGKQGDSCYLVEFSDSILASANYDFAIYSHNSGALTYFKKGESGYDVVKVSRGSLDVLATSHVSNDGWQSASKGGNASGTVGQSKAVEAITLNLQNAPPTMVAWSTGRMFPITVGKIMRKRGKSPVLRGRASPSRLFRFA